MILNVMQAVRGIQMQLQSIRKPRQPAAVQLCCFSQSTLLAPQGSQIDGISFTWALVQ